MDGQTVLVEAVEKGPHDDAVLKALRAVRGKPTEGPTNWRIGVRNEAGEIYRVIYLSNMEEAVALSERLERIGFIDELPQDSQFIPGCDTTFRQKWAIGQEAPELPGPRLFWHLGKVLFNTGGVLLLVGLIAQVSLLFRAAAAQGKLQTVMTLSSAYPNLPTGWIPESWVSFAACAVILIIGWLLLVESERAMKSPAP